MRKILCMILVGIICVGLFSGCGSNSSNMARVAPKIINGKFIMTPEEFRAQFNAAKLLDVKPLDKYKELNLNGIKSYVFMYNLSSFVQVVTKEKDYESHLIKIGLINKNEKSKNDLKMFEKQVQSLIRWSNLKVNDENIDEFMENLKLDDYESLGERVFEKDGLKYTYLVDDHLSLSIAISDPSIASSIKEEEDSKDKEQGPAADLPDSLLFKVTYSNFIKVINQKDPHLKDKLVLQKQDSEDKDYIKYTYHIQDHQAPDYIRVHIICGAKTNRITYIYTFASPHETNLIYYMNLIYAVNQAEFSSFESELKQWLIGLFKQENVEKTKKFGNCYVKYKRLSNTEYIDVTTYKM